MAPTRTLKKTHVAFGVMSRNTLGKFVFSHAFDNIGQNRTQALQQKASLFDHFVCTDEQRGRHGEAERFSCLHVDH